MFELAARHSSSDWQNTPCPTGCSTGCLAASPHRILSCLPGKFVSDISSSLPGEKNALPFFEKHPLVLVANAPDLKESYPALASSHSRCVRQKPPAVPGRGLTGVAGFGVGRCVGRFVAGRGVGRRVGRFATGRGVGRRVGAGSAAPSLAVQNRRGQPSRQQCSPGNPPGHGSPSATHSSTRLLGSSAVHGTCAQNESDVARRE